MKAISLLEVCQLGLYSKVHIELFKQLLALQKRQEY
jgi:hypothetical protein